MANVEYGCITAKKLDAHLGNYGEPIKVNMPSDAKILDVLAKGSGLFVVYEHGPDHKSNEKAYYFIVCKGDANKPERTEWIKSVLIGHYADAQEILHVLRDYRSE